MRKLIKKILKESEDEFDWVNNENSLDGVKVITRMGNELTIIDNGGKYVEVTWNIGGGGRGSTKYDKKSVEAMIARGTWKLDEPEKGYI